MRITFKCTTPVVAGTIGNFNFCLFLMVFPLFFMSCGDQRDQINWDPQKPNTLNEVLEHFENPPIDYSTAPLWVWNDRVTKDKIDFMLKDFKDHGIHMAFIHPRPGLITEYLSDEWFELVRHTVDKARELDMKIWLYDENSYPSGFAGGHVPAAMFAQTDPVTGLKMHLLNEITEQDTTGYFIILKQSGDSFVNITNSTDKYYGKPGKYYAFTKWYYPKRAWMGGFSYVDLLAYGITEKFIKVTMDGYEEYIGDEFGKLVPGIFTDEPNINTGDRNVIRFTPALFSKFEKKYGYQLQTYLPCLLDEVGDWENVRHDYQQLLLEMFIERWSKPWNKYTDEHNLNWTGHYWEHGWPNPKHGPDNMAMYAWHQYPGIDMLFNTDDRPDQFGNIRAVKELSSVVDQLGKSRALCETYGGAGWEITFNDMKRLGDWTYVLGVNFMNQHLSHMTLKGARKRDYPQSFTYHTPWWDDYKPLADYYHRLSWILSAGRQVNKVLILEPTSTAWMYYSPLGKKEEGKGAVLMEKMKKNFDDMLKALEKNQIEYDLASEDIIKDHGSVAGPEFIIGSRNYDIVILPSGFENIEIATFDLLARYLENDGTVLSLSGIPQRLDGNKSTTVAKELGKYKDHWIDIEKIDTSVMEKYLMPNGFVALDPENWGGEVYHMRRRMKDGQILFFTNFHRTESAHISFSAEGSSMMQLDVMNAEQHVLKTTENHGMVSLSFDLPPSGSMLLMVWDKTLRGKTLDINAKKEEKLLQSSETVVQQLSPNTLTIEYCDLRVEGEQYNDIYFYNAADTVYKVYLKEPYGFNYNPWSNAVQYRTRILDKNTFGENTGFEVSYHFTLQQGFRPDSLHAVVESPQLYTVFINGQKVDPQKGRWWLDRDFGVYDIVDHVMPGKNTLKVIAKPMDILAEIEPVYLFGDFGVKPRKKGWLLEPPGALKTGSWKAQGLPFYSDKVAYLKTFEKPATGKVKIKLNKWAGSVVRVLINDQYAGIIGWAPWEIDISPYLRDGTNKVEVIVTGNLKNLMGPHHNNPRRGLVSPWSFFYAPLHQPSGDEYDLMDYGLFEDFEVIQY